jgi:response regulator RpfG family c-di-GMP phosphodiesterase
MPSDDRPHILCVDDEPSVLDGLGRTLRRRFRLEVATEPQAALELIKGSEPFAAVVSDLRMPGMDGVTFLARVRESFPDTVRILLTGGGDLQAAIAAVNQGHIFRFLTKPCPSDVISSALDAAAEHYRLVTAERVLLEQTLQGSIETLSGILALAQPAAFGHATRARQRVRELLDHFKISERWPVEVAALLSPIACVTLPPQTADKLYHGQALSDAEQKMVARLPQVTEDLLAPIPRLESVRAILRSYPRRYEESSTSLDESGQPVIEWGSHALKIVLDYDALERQGLPTADALKTMRGRRDWYDPALFEAFAQMRGSRDGAEIREVSLNQVELGMVFAEDVRTLKGLLLIARGQEVNSSLLERIKNFSSGFGVKEPLRVIVRGA